LGQGDEGTAGPLRRGLTRGLLGGGLTQGARCGAVQQLPPAARGPADQHHRGRPRTRPRRLREGAHRPRLLPLRPHCPQADQRASWVRAPPRTVARTGICEISVAATCPGWASRATKSASFPRLSVPLSAPCPIAAAAFTV